MTTQYTPTCARCDHKLSHHGTASGICMIEQCGCGGFLPRTTRADTAPQPTEERVDHTPELLKTAKELLEACAAALRVIAEIDTPTRLKDLLGTPESREQALMDELRIAGVGDGFGIRAKAVIAKVEGREA